MPYVKSEHQKCSQQRPHLIFRSYPWHQKRSKLWNANVSDFCCSFWCSDFGRFDHTFDVLIFLTFNVPIILKYFWCSDPSMLWFLTFWPPPLDSCGCFSFRILQLPYLLIFTRRWKSKPGKKYAKKLKNFH